ncbi:MAG: glycosyltransferase [Lyngbya sp.]|nr:glycosyltransferase [Lyngbya sp.]
MSKVSILMSVYNGTQHLNKAVESILEQTFSDFEFVIVDDGSTDNSWQLLTDYAAQDSRIVLIQNEKNIGLERSLNKGLSKCKGEYLARQDADDISFPNRLELQTQFLDTHPEVGALGTAVELINQTGAFIGKDYLPPDHDSLQALLFFNNFMHHSTLMARRQLMQDAGGYNINLRYAEDYDLWWRLSRLSQLATLPETLLYRRMDDSPRISKLHREAQLLCSFKISLRAVQESLGNQALNVEAYERFWWSYLKLLDQPAYKQFWQSRHGQQGLMTSKDIQRLQPVWNLLANHRGGAKVWGSRLQQLAYHLLRNQQTIEGIQLLRITTQLLKTPIHWETAIKALIRPYIPSPEHQIWQIWKTKQVGN